MKAVVLYEAGQQLKVEDFDTPPIGDDDVLIKVTACGVCHTDLKVAEGRTRFTPPTILGHEVSGTIEQVGVRYKGFFKEGDRVIIGMRYKCGRCRYCLAGRENLCSNRPMPPALKKKDGALVYRWNVGGFSQYVAVPGYMVFSLPEGLPLEESSVIGCRVTTAYNAVKHGAALEPGDSALVIGCGGIGLNTIQFLRCFGAFPIIAADIIDEKLEDAKRFGATHTINARTEDPVEATKRITDGGVDKAFEAIGNTQTADQIVRATRPGGTAVIIGGLGRGPFTINDARFAMNEIKVTGVSSRRANDVEEVLRMVKDQRIEVQSLITKRYGYEEINEALEDLKNGRLLMGITLWN
ncbi:MAG: alcohol dehydrogenase catalytic domain-containing protein [Deltaproteobacteria bacterium]|nr:alcohol dehydrogenase catalytic domain-containing protein [Deltaproteobacteria bacterium]